MTEAPADDYPAPYMLRVVAAQVKVNSAYGHALREMANGNTEPFRELACIAEERLTRLMLERYGP